MNRRHRRCAVLAACSILFTACSDDITSRADNSGSADNSSPADAYVLLLDDDSQPDQVLGEPGTYALTARGAGTPPLAVLDVPAGYSNFGFFGLWPTGSGGEGSQPSEQPFRAVNYWTVHGVFPDPCERGGQAAPAAGTSVEELAAALEAQDFTSTSEPMPVSLDGHQGLYIELSVSRAVSFDDCETGYFTLWEAERGNAQHVADSPGTVERMWIMDLDGERAVLVAIAAPGVTRAKAEELNDMIDSVHFVQPQ